MASNQMDSITTISKDVLLKSTTVNIKFYPDMFDILDHDDEFDHNMNEQQLWDRMKEEFNLNYKFDNTYDNMQEEEEEEQEESMENISTTSNIDNLDNEVMINYCFHFYEEFPYFFL